MTNLSNPFQAPEAPDVPVTDESTAPEETPERTYTPAEGLDPEAPYGYTIDRKTGEKRPRKRAGRGVRVVKVEEPAPAGAPKTEREPDRVPGRVKPESKERRTRTRTAKPEPEPLPPFRAGPIAKGVNRLYLRGGKILKAMDKGLGIAVIEMTKPTFDDEGERVEGDLTVGEAWEAVAQVNPRIRRLLLKFIEGGAWSALFWAHVPLLLAIMMKERVARRIPFARLLASFMDDGDDGTAVDGPGGLLAGLTEADIAQAQAMFNLFMPGAAAEMAENGEHGYATVRERNGTVRPATTEDLGFGDAPA